MDAPTSANTRSASDAQTRALEQAFAAHEAWAYEAAYVSYRRTLYGAAYGVLADAQLSEDCVHDVLVRLWQRSGEYRPARGRLEAFLAVCVRNEALSRRRRDNNRLRIARSAPPPAEADPFDDRYAGSLDVRDAVRGLSQPQQHTLQMAYFEGLTHEEIAKRLGEPVGTIKSRLSNALKSLRRTMGAKKGPA
ncbi:MAG TPA: sigma-70 family RNA polymerase sigma factor [Candidatus Baltobacteraceae bacterium]|nr:sigma-70 family RNA polymerase sigma factor [Candidatus Baltobacteraceae bacterium]